MFVKESQGNNFKEIKKSSSWKKSVRENMREGKAKERGEGREESDQLNLIKKKPPKLHKQDADTLKRQY